jgi:starvation-inducible DNA-binding protein
MLFTTRIDLPEKVRTPVIGLLNERLAETIDLALQVKQAHWNVKGPNFIGLHKLFDELRDEVDEAVDDIAERIAALGGVAEGTIQAVGTASKLSAYPLKLTTGHAHVEALASAVAAVGKSIRAAIDRSDELKDASTSDLFTQISRTLDKYLWFLEAHLQADR